MKLIIYHKFFRGRRSNGSLFHISYSIGESSGESEMILIPHKYQEYFENDKVEIEVDHLHKKSVQEIINKYLDKEYKETKNKTSDLIDLAWSVEIKIHHVPGGLEVSGEPLCKIENPELVRLMSPIVKKLFLQIGTELKRLKGKNIDG